MKAKSGNRFGAPGKHGCLPKVSNFGRFQTAFGHRYKPRPKKDGYCMVGFQSPSSRITVGFHRVVHIVINDPNLSEFANGDTVDHIDIDRANNVSSNLRWASKTSQALNRNDSQHQTGHRVVITNSNGQSFKCKTNKDAAKIIGVDSSQLSRRKYVNGWTVERVDPDFQGEEWKTISTVPLFKVSSFGRIMSTKSDKHFPSSNHNQYIRKRGKQLHAIILEAFGFKKPSPLHTPDHIDRNPNNNALSNLRWALPEEQAKNKSTPSSRPMKSVECRQVGQSEWKRYENSPAAKIATGVEVHKISNVCSALTRTRTAPGLNGIRYEFRYANDESQEDLPNEVWKDVDPLDWLPGGKYYDI